MTIRAATEDDILPVKMLWAAADEENTLPPPYRAGSVEDVPKRIAAGDVLVAEEDEGQVCGYVAFVILGELYSGVSIYVAKDCRGRGIAADLLEVAHAIATVRGARRALTFLGRESNLLPFYAKAGYSDSGHVLTKEL